MCIMGPEDQFGFYTIKGVGEKTENRIEAMGGYFDGVLGGLSIPVLYYPNEEIVVAIEWQAIRPGDPRPNDILNLAAVAGMLLGMVLCHWPAAKILRPFPVQWKGSIPKEIHQERILKGLDGVPRLNLLSVPKVVRGHIIDGLGLSIWAKETTEKRLRVSKAVALANAARKD